MNWHEYYLNLLDPIAVKSKDPNTKLGCVIVGPDNEIRSTGYNSFPRGINDNVPERLVRPEKYLWIEHAERNAIYNKALCGGPGLKGCRLYIGIIPCMDCARAIVQAGITEVIFDADKQAAYPGGATWIEGWTRVGIMFGEAGVKLHGWQKNGSWVEAYMLLPSLALNNAASTI
jgi:dCMP deaminase